MRHLKKSHIVILTLLIIILAFSLLPAFSHKAYKAPESIELNNLKELAMILHDYARDHEGNFPVHISDLPVGKIPPTVLHYRDLISGNIRDWQYFPNRHIDDPETTFLAASPIIPFANPQRLVTYVNTSTTIVLEADFQQQLRSQPKR